MSKEIKVGDKIVFGRGKKNRQLIEDGYGIVIGKVYNVTDCCGETAIQIVDYGMPNHLSEFESSAKITKIVEG